MVAAAILDVVTMVPGYQTHGMVGEQLAAAANVDPETALGVLEHLLAEISAENALAHYDLIEHAAPQVLASALDANQTELTKRARRLLNKLGSAGHLDLEKQVNGHRKAPD